jgi:hypothetical protein
LITSQSTPWERGRVEFMVDADNIEKGKADRYVRKLRARFPRLVEVGRRNNDPVPNVTTVVVMVRRDS